MKGKTWLLRASDSSNPASFRGAEPSVFPAAPSLVAGIAPFPTFGATPAWGPCSAGQNCGEVKALQCWAKAQMTSGQEGYKCKYWCMVYVCVCMQNEALAQQQCQNPVQWAATPTMSSEFPNVQKTHTVIPICLPPCGMCIHLIAAELWTERRSASATKDNRKGLTSVLKGRARA